MFLPVDFEGSVFDGVLLKPKMVLRLVALTFPQNRFRDLSKKDSSESLTTKMMRAP